MEGVVIRFWNVDRLVTNGYWWGGQRLVPSDDSIIIRFDGMRLPRHPGSVGQRAATVRGPFFPPRGTRARAVWNGKRRSFLLSRETGEEARARDLESETTGALVPFRTVSYNSCVWKGQYRAGIGQMKAWRAARVVVLVRPPGTMEREKGLGHTVLCCRCVCESTTSTAGCLTGRPLLILPFACNSK